MSHGCLTSLTLLKDRCVSVHSTLTMSLVAGEYVNVAEWLASPEVRRKGS
jgi:hypothetical protein